MAYSLPLLSPMFMVHNTNGLLHFFFSNELQLESYLTQYSKPVVPNIGVLQNHQEDFLK